MNQLTQIRIPAKTKRFLTLLVALTLLCSLFAITAYATTTNNDVAGGVTNAFDTYMKPQYKKIVNNVVFPIIDGIVAIIFVFKLIFAIVNYRKNTGAEFEWHSPALLFCALVIAATGPLWVWGLIKW